MSETLINTNQNQLNNDDASFVELIQKAQKGKAKVAQAIINKGGDVSTASTYAQLTQAVNNLDTADGKGKYLVESFYDVYSNANNVPSDIIMATFLPYHNALIGITTSGVISIYKSNNDGDSIIPIASVSTGLSVSTDAKHLSFGFNKSETKFAFYDNSENNKYLVVVFMDWATSTMELKLNYVVQSTVSTGDKKEYYNDDGAHYLGITINESGSCIIYLSTFHTYASPSGQRYCLTTFIPDYSNNTVTENTGFNQPDYGFPKPTPADDYTTTNSIYYLDTENNVIEGVDPWRRFFTFDIDLEGTYPKITNYTVKYSSPLSNGTFPLVLKNIDNTLDCYVYFSVYNDRTATLYLNKYSGMDNTLYDALTFKLIGDGINTSYYFFRIYYALFYPRYFHINYYIKNNEIYLLLPSNIIVKVDKTGITPRLVIVNTNGLQVGDEYLVRPVSTNIDANPLYTYTKLYSPTNYDKMLMIYSPSSNFNYANCRLNEITRLREPCVLGQKFVDSQGNEFYAQLDFSMSSYEEGSYRLTREANTLEI